MGVGVPDGKIGRKLEKCLLPQRFETNFYYLSLNGKNTTHSNILIPNILSDFKIEPENSKKNYVFEQILNHSLNFERLLPLISGLNPKSKLDYATLRVLNRRLVSQSFVLKSYLYEKKKHFVGSTLTLYPPPPPPPPLLRSGRVKVSSCPAIGSSLSVTQKVHDFRYRK